MSPKSRCRAWPLNLIFSPDPATSAPGRRGSPGGETEADTARVGVARAFNLVRWLEDLLALAPRKTRSLVFDSDDDTLGFGDQADGGASTIFHSIVDGSETARRKAVGRPDIEAPRGPENVTGSPASEAFSQFPRRVRLSRWRPRLVLRVISRKGEYKSDHVAHNVDRRASSFADREPLRGQHRQQNAGAMESTSHAVKLARENFVATGSTAGGGTKGLAKSRQWPSERAASTSMSFWTRPSPVPAC